MLDNGVKEKVLGIQWHVKGDYFTFDIHVNKKSFTRRGLLSMTASVYDPMGFVAPVILEAKLLLQDLCKQKVNWDSVISEEERVRWSRWLEELPYLNELRIPRCFTQVAAASYEIHCFADASSFAYGACSYLRIIDTKGFVHCSFLLGKSRLAPIKSISIPKLELTAAVLAVRLGLSCLLKAELDLPVVSTFWTDSTAVLHCIKNNTKRFPVFVANRLTIIEQNTELDCWRHVPSNLNPADLASRGIRANSNEVKRWLKGPEFLTKPRTEWPTNKLSNLTPPEEFISAKEQTICSTLESHFTGELNSIDKLINRCSNLYKLKRLTAWILKYKFFLQNRNSFDCKLKILKQITVENLQNAEIELVKYTQRQHFPYLFTKTSSHRWPLFMRKINPIFLDGVARVGGRLAQLDIDVDIKHPIIMPQCSHLTELVIRQHHDKLGHAGTSHTWASLRQRFWVVKGAAAVRHSIGQ